MKNIILILLVVFVNAANAQDYEPLTGRFVYRIQPLDTSLRKLIPEQIMVVYTNDTLVRIENETSQLGKQALIKHFEFNKSYLLVSHEGKNYAIQTDYGKTPEKASKYTFKKKWGKRKILDKKAKRMMVSHPDFPKPLEFLYFKDYAPKYIDAFPDFPGLPVLYYISTADAVLEYRLEYFEKTEVDKVFFGVPADHIKLTFDEFLDIYLGSKPE